MPTKRTTVAKHPLLMARKVVRKTSPQLSQTGVAASRNRSLKSVFVAKNLACVVKIIFSNSSSPRFAAVIACCPLSSQWPSQCDYYGHYCMSDAVIRSLTFERATKDLYLYQTTGFHCCTPETHNLLWKIVGLAHH
jgi:hypothetical protein